MKRSIVVLTAIFVSGVCSPTKVTADEVNSILDKAIKAIGGEEKLSKIKAASWKGKGTITFGGSDNEYTGQSTVQGLDHFRSEFEGEFMGNKIKGTTVVAGDKAWRKFADQGMELDNDAVANEKRVIYLNVIPVTIVPLKSKDFKVETANEEQVNGKLAAALKVTPKDGKEFTIYFDKDNGLPVKLVAKVKGFQGDEYTQETTYGDYKDMAGIKKATKIESKRDGEKFVVQQVTEFEILDKVDAKTFAEPS